MNVLAANGSAPIELWVGHCRFCLPQVYAKSGNRKISGDGPGWQTAQARLSQPLKIQQPERFRFLLCL